MINTDKPNKTWRILHRVTYVERPALMGFGKDTRPLLGNENGISVDNQLEKIDKNIIDIETNTNQLKRKIARLESALKIAKEQNNSMGEKLESIIKMLKEK